MKHIYADILKADLVKQANAEALLTKARLLEQQTEDLTARLDTLTISMREHQALVGELITELLP